jgi:hypothetical protein
VRAAAVAALILFWPGGTTSLEAVSFIGSFSFVVIHNVVSSPPKYQGRNYTEERCQGREEGYQGWVPRKEGSQGRNETKEEYQGRQEGRLPRKEGREDVEGGRMSKKEGRRYSF